MATIARPSISLPRRARARSESQSVDARKRLSRLISLLGSNSVAEMLGVSKSQPSRWSRSKEGISAANVRRIVDLDYVVTRFLQEWDRELLPVWFASQNPYLGARPADVLRMEGAGPLVTALDASAEGAYA